jgi:hypothetical protein
MAVGGEVLTYAAAAQGIMDQFAKNVKGHIVLFKILVLRRAFYLTIKK